jgi:hypothetical protein
MNLNSFNEALEKRAKSVLTEAEAKDMSAKKAADQDGWFYFPKKSYMGGTMKPLVREVSPDKWEILFCAPQSKASKKAEKGGEELMASKEMQKYINLLNEGTVEGDKGALDDWYVKAKWSGPFEECLKKCVSIVEGKTEAVPSQFKK